MPTPLRKHTHDLVRGLVQLKERERERERERAGGHSAASDGGRQSTRPPLALFKSFVKSREWMRYDCQIMPAARFLTARTMRPPRWMPLSLWMRGSSSLCTRPQCEWPASCPISQKVSSWIMIRPAKLACNEMNILLRTHFVLGERLGNRLESLGTRRITRNY